MEVHTKGETKMSEPSSTNCVEKIISSYDDTPEMGWLSGAVRRWFSIDLWMGGRGGADDRGPAWGAR